MPFTYLPDNYKRSISYLLILFFFAVNIFFTTEGLRFSSAKIEMYNSHLIVVFILYFIALSITIQYLVFKDYAYFFYVIYINVNIGYFCLIYHSHPEIFQQFPDWYNDLGTAVSLPMLTLVYLAYTLFAMKFVGLHRAPKGYKRYQYCVRIYLLLFGLSLLLNLLPPGSGLKAILRNIVLLLCMPVGITAILIIYSHLKTTIVRIFLLGSFCFLTGSIIGFLLSNRILSYPSDTAPFNNWVFYTQLGTLLEVILFTSSFAYRSKVMIAEDLQIKESLHKEILENKEKEFRLKTIRNEIASNLHDDIGATLSSINILNELAQRNASNPEKASEYLARAGEDIQRISEDLSDIVWNINPRYDDIQNLFIRMRHYAISMLEGKDIKHQVVFPEDESGIVLEMEKRRELYLIFKEAVNNLAKYSAAKNARICITTSEEVLELLIEDDGVGFEPKDLSTGNGLHNMKQRARHCGGSLVLNSVPGQGTRLVFRMGITL